MLSIPYIVSVINTATLEATATVVVGTGAYGVATSKDGKNVFVTNKGSNNVSVIDTALNSVIGTITVGKGPAGVTIKE